jgi:hypothetical protein
MEDGAKEKDVLGKLMGRPGAKENVVIQEVEEHIGDRNVIWGRMRCCGTRRVTRAFLDCIK